MSKWKHDAHCGLRRTLCALLVLVMLIGLVPMPNANAADNVSLYLQPNSNWTQSDAWFAVYYWNNSGNHWVRMTASATDGVYEAEIPSGYTNVIFCRMNPAMTALSWDSKWDQTKDLTYDGTKNLFTVGAGQWNNATGTWSVYEPPVTNYNVTTNLTNLTSSNAAAAIEAGAVYTTTLKAKAGYALPASVSVTVGGVADSTHTYSSETGVLTIPAASVTGDIVITAEADAYTYLKPNANWLLDGARFAVYSWDINNGNWWADLTDEDGDGYYEVVLPEGITNLIFCRMNPGTTDNNWNNKWNQTSDLKRPTDGSNCYTVAEGAWDKGAGTWSTYLPEEEEEGPTQPTEPDEPADTYYVAGDKALCGVEWDCAAAANKMDYVGSGIYEKTYTSVAAGTYNIKVTDGTWSNSWGDNGNNYTFKVTAACDVTVTFDSNTKTVSVKGDSVGKETGLEVTAMYAVGNGSGNWLNGVNWDPGAAVNVMTEIAPNVYEITFEDVAKGSAYEFKFAANGTWTHSWGAGGTKDEAAYNGQNIKLTVSYEKADVTLKLDMTGYDHSKKTGAKYSVTVTEAAEEAGPDYYLVGYINGADYGCEDDYANLGEYKFVDGKLTATFTQDSYVFVKTGDNANWFMSEGYAAESPAILYNTNKGLTDANKLFAPGGVELTFTLVENADGSLTLSYVKADAETPEIPEDYTAVTIHFLKTEGWGSSINGYVWCDAGAVAGYEAYNTWPGKALPANGSHPGWYDLVVATPKPMAFNFIFNDGGNQTADLFTGEVTGDTELWVIGNNVMTTAPGEWTGDYDYTANIYFLKPDSWGNTINAWIWGNDGSTIPGYEKYHTTWPGSAIDADPVNAGWYTVSVTMDENDGFNFIFNDGASQTTDLSTGTLDVTTNLWVVGEEVLKTAPAGFVDPNRKVYVPGTFPGPSWDAGSNQMTYDPDLGLYVYTFENVPAANYEFKIAINGSWNENYGAGGAKDGSNIAVTVPKTMDVIVYYNDNTHYAVTNITYIFADITLSGSGIAAGTKLTDPGLTGIYSATVDMAAGTYTDVKLNYNGKDYVFAQIVVDQDKAVTFYMDPVTEIYYCNASNDPVDTKDIFFDSQDQAYKAPFGAAATGEEVTFSIATGDDVTSAVLVVKGVASYPMTKDDSGKWTVTASFDNIGEYDYYFVLSNGSAVAVYGDDDGYYGTGCVTDLTNVLPYDLVVYKAGYETPDWMKNAVIYQIFPDRFFDGEESNNDDQTHARGSVDYEYITDWYTLPENPEQEAMLDKETYLSSGAHYGDGEWSNEIYGGDLQGIIQRIDYLKALGVNVIYLNPIFASISNHRYDTSDYMEIDPILGDLGDFEELVAVAEANDMHIILDGVFNHVSDDSIYFDRYYRYLGTSEKIGAYPYWAYVYDYMAENAASQADAEAAAKAFFSENYGITDYAYTEWFQVNNAPMAGAVDSIGLRAGKSVYSYDGWWGYDSMPIIYSTNGSEYQTGNWAEEVIGNEDGTSVSQFWISKGNNGWRLDVANEVSDETWQEFRASVKALDSDAVIIGEIWDDATKYLMGDMYDAVMNYMFRNAVTSFAMGASAADTTKALEKIRERYPEEAFYAMMNLVGSHDTTRILSYLDGIGDDRNQKDFDSAFPTYEKTSDLAKNRQYLVSFLQFTYAGAPTIYYGDEIGMVGSDDPDDRRTFEWGKGNQELVEWYATLAAIREAYPALRTGAVEPMDISNGYLLGYYRDNLIVIANNSTSEQTWQLGESAVVDLISGTAYEAGDTVKIPGLRGVILVAADEVANLELDLDGLKPAYDEAYIVAERSETPPEAPVEPDEPEDPDKPTEPDDPTVPSEPEDPTDPEMPTDPEKPTTPGGDSADTGDRSGIYVFVALLAVSLVGIVILVVINYNKKKKK